MKMDKPDIQKLLVVIVVFTVAFGFRLGAVNGTKMASPYAADAGEYYRYALNLKHHGTYSKEAYQPDATPRPNALRQPLYAVFLAPFVVSPPTDAMLWRVLLAQALLGSLTAVLTLFIFRSMLPFAWATAAALLVAISPHLISMTTYLLSETLFIFILYLFVWLLIRTVHQDSGRYAFIAGVMLALAFLTRPSVQYLVVPVLLVLLVNNGWRKHLKLAIPLFLGYCLAVSPWMVRNIQTTGHASDPTLKINTLHHGLYPDFQYQSQPATTGFAHQYDPRSKEISASTGAVLTEIKRRFTEEPARYLRWYLVDKPVSLLSWSIVQGMGDIYIYFAPQSPYRSSPTYITSHAVMAILHWPLVILAILAAILVWIPSFGESVGRTALFSLRALSMVLLYNVLLHMVGAPFPRYGIPLRPAIYGLALFMLYRCYGYFLAYRAGNQLSTSGGLRR